MPWVWLKEKKKKKKKTQMAYVQKFSILSSFAHDIAFLELSVLLLHLVH